MMLGGFNYIRASQALICVGAAEATLRETVAHTSSRVAFGKPLAANQAVSFALAEAATKLDAARWMCCPSSSGPATSSASSWLTARPRP
jgi:cyclohexanecarboxyl-CoA dehydrogenase